MKDKGKRQGNKERTMANLLWTVVVVLFVLWLLGFAMNFGGAIIHFLLVAAVIILIYNLLTTGRATI